MISKEATVGSYFLLWPLFCFQAGLINSGGFLACHRFVSHITGFGTRVGFEFVNQNFMLGLEMLLIPFGFMLGCFIAGYFNEVKENKFSVPLILMSFILFLVACLGYFNLLGTFGEPLMLQRDFLLLFLLCFSCGLQNSIIASLTGGLVRTTHMTGVATDLSLSLVRLIKGEPSEKNWLKLRFAKLVLFALGATFGAIIFSKMEYLGFLIPGGMNLILFYFLKRNMLRTGLL